MIFVTVGTHKQQFDRLIKEVDDLKTKGIIKENVFIQVGHSTYLPTSCRYERFISFQEMENMFEEASLVITHGAPASVILSLRHKKPPIVVPRQVKYREHVTDHQVAFTELLEQKQKIIAVYDIEKLRDSLTKYEQLVRNLERKHGGTTSSKASEYIDRLDKICSNL